MQQQYLTVAQQRLALAKAFSSRCPRLRQSSFTMQMYRDTESLVIGSAARIEEDMGRLSYSRTRRRGLLILSKVPVCSCHRLQTCKLSHEADMRGSVGEWWICAEVTTAAAAAPEGGGSASVEPESEGSARALARELDNHAVPSPRIQCFYCLPLSELPLAS